MWVHGSAKVSPLVAIVFPASETSISPEAEAGQGVALADSEDPTTAQLFGLEGIDFDASTGYLYYSDGNSGEGGPHHRVRPLTFE